MPHGSITRADIIRALTKKVGLPRSDCAAILEDIWWQNRVLRRKPWIGIV